jgi:hypothetical protein
MNPQNSSQLGTTNPPQYHFQNYTSYRPIHQAQDYQTSAKPQHIYSSRGAAPSAYQSHLYSRYQQPQPVYYQPQYHHDNVHYSQPPAMSSNHQPTGTFVNPQPPAFATQMYPIIEAKGNSNQGHVYGQADHHHTT